MKTILIPVCHRQQVKAILLGDVLKELEQKTAMRSVILVPPYRVDEFKKEFHEKNVIFEKAPSLPHISRIDTFFERISRSYTDTPSNRFFRKKWLFWNEKKVIRYIGSLVLLFLLGNIKILRTFLRSLDFHLVRDELFLSLFKQYSPDLVLLPRIESALDQALLRHAKRSGIKTIGVINSWESIAFPRSSLRLLPDTFIVHNSIVKDLIVSYLGVRPSRIFVSGIPGFDQYIARQRMSKEAFYKKFAIDPSKKIILFASVAARNPTEYQVLKLLNQAIEGRKLPEDIVFLVRNHPQGDMVKGTLVKGDLEPSEHIIFDNAKTFLEGGKTYLESLAEDLDHIADSLYHAEMVITTASSISIDAAFFGKPIINIGFDGEEKKPFHESVAHYYTPYHPYYMSVGKSDGINVVRSFDELISSINRYLKDPALDKDARKKMTLEQCYKLDGKSSKRAADVIMEEITR